MAQNKITKFKPGSPPVVVDLKASGFAEGSAADRDPLAAGFMADHDLPMVAMVMSLFDSSDDCIKLIDGQGQLALMNCNGRAALEIDDFSLVEGQHWTSLWPKEAESLIEDAMARAKAGQRSRFEAFCPTWKGTPRWWEVTVAPVPNQGGEVEWVLASSRDITQRVMHVEQLETLALEMRHRLRNAFAVSSGIIGAMARAEREHAAFAKDVVTRLTQLAAVHAGLMDYGGQMQLNDLLNRVLLIDSKNRIIQLGSIAAVDLNESMAKALALVIGELATNSMKYGALGNGGKIRIEAVRDERQLVIEWHESDGLGSNASQPLSSGQGSQLNQRMLASIGASLNSEELPDGYFARVTIPLPPQHS